jgi:putative hydrolase of the HAD superfamily
LQLKFQFLDDFDTKVFSYEVGFLKPDKRIFQELVKRSGVKPEEILYSDDCEEKLTGAKEIGIQTFVFRDFDQFMAELKTQGVNI